MKTSKKVWLELKKLGLMPEKLGDNIKFTYQMMDCIYIQDKEGQLQLQGRHVSWNLKLSECRRMPHDVTINILRCLSASKAK